MVYSAISAYSSGQVPTAAQLNQARDNLNSIYGFNDAGVRLWLSADQVIPNITDTNINWTSVDNGQVGSIWSGGANLTAPVAGYYMVLLNTEWIKNTSPERTQGIYKAGVRYSLGQQGSSDGGNNQSAADVFFLTAGQAIQAFVYQSSGVNLKLRGGARDRTSVAMWLMGAS